MSKGYSKTYLWFSSMSEYLKDIPWLLFNRKPYFDDMENCGRLFCSHCGGNWFHKNI